MFNNLISSAQKLPNTTTQRSSVRKQPVSSLHQPSQSSLQSYKIPISSLTKSSKQKQQVLSLEQLSQ